MSAAQQWTAGICLAVLGVSLLQHLLPEGAMRRMGELAAGLFFLCAVLLPLAGAVPDLPRLFSALPQAEQGEPVEQAVQEQCERAVRESLTSLITAELSREGIPAAAVQVDVNTQEDGSISITNITVTLPAASAGECERAGSVLSAVLGLEAEVKTDAG